MKILPTTKSLATILLGAGLIFGTGNQLKAQRENVEYYNHDNDEFSEEILGYREEDVNQKTNLYEQNKMGITIIYYSDKNNDDFHEYVRVWNCNKLKRLLIEDFYIDKSTGLIDYSFKKYAPHINKWNKYYSGKTFLSIAQENNHENLFCVDKKFYPNLTQQDIYNLYQGFGERVKRLVNASKDRTALENMVNSERLRMKSLK